MSSDWLLSLALHGAVIGAAAFGMLYAPSGPEPETVPIYFEVVEAAAAPDGVEEPVADAPPGETEVERPSHLEQEEAPPSTQEEDDAAQIEPEEPAPPDVQPDVQRKAPPSEEAPPSEAMEELAHPHEDVQTPADGGDPSLAEESPEERAAVVSAPIALGRIVPAYPRSARRKGHEGCVTVAVNVSEDGAVVGAEVVSSSGYGELDAAALEAVGTARFAPATEDGVSVRGDLRLTFDFRLK